MSRSAVQGRKVRAGGMAFATRVLVLALCFSLGFPLNLIGDAMQASARSIDADGTAYVLQRLNSAERKAAIAEASRMDAAAREEYARNEAGISSQPESGDTIRNGKTISVMSPDSSVVTARGELRGHDPNAKQAPRVTASNERIRDRVPEIRGTTDSTRPKTMTEVMFNGVTGFMGMPGLAGSQYAPYDPNIDQGLGFHADGTARRADGTTGNNAASSNFDGRRAASYAGSGLGYGSYGNYGGMGGSGTLTGHYGPGYDPTTGHNFRYGDSTYLGQSNRQGNGYGLFNMNDPQSYFMQRGLNYGMGLANSAAEGLFLGFMESPYGGAKARFNFMVDLDGRVNGEGDVLLPFYDSKYTTVFTQLGARSMSGMSGGDSDGRGADRWIGNFGLGQRWYPMAVNDGTGQDAGNLMLGYNVFFDNDFTRSHQRGGVGIEAQYDWMHLASNYYMPLSGWKGSKDFDSDFVKERAAEGWDIRAKGYLPFYRNVALTGAYTQWKGDHVGMFSSRKLEKDPAVWSYGVEYTPIPLVSGFVNQRSTERGKSDTEFGLRMTYTFNMPWDQQTSHAKVAETRTVGGSRHEFVDRENRIILEYKAKNNFHIEYIGKVGTNQFKFRIRNGFDKYVAGQTVKVTAGGGVTLAEAKTPAQAAPAAPTTFLAQAGEFLGSLFSVRSAHAADFSQTYTTDGNGEFIVKLDNVTVTPVVLNLQAGNSNQSVTLHDATVTVFAYTLEASPATLTQHAPANVTFTVKRNGVAVPNNTSVTFASNASFTGLPTTAQTTNASGQITVSNLTVTASGPQSISATVEGQPVSVNMAVTAATYSLEASPATLTLNSPANVTFTVKRNGVAVPNNTSVTFASNASFTGLPTTAQTTNASGQITVSNLTVTASGPQSISATVEGQPVSVNMAVTAATYSLEASPATLTLNSPANVTFTVKSNGSAVGSGVNVIFASNSNFTGLPTTAQNTDASGQITVSNLTVTASGPQSISAKVNIGAAQSVSVPITVTAATPEYTLPGGITVSTNNSPADGSTANVVQVQVYDSANSANAGAGVPVTWSVTPSAGITLVGGNTSQTNASGIAEMRITDNGGSSRSVAVKAEVGGGGSGKVQDTTVNFAAVTYTLSQTPATSIAVGQTVSTMPFTLTANGSPVPDGTSVSLAYSTSPGAFTTSNGTATVGGGNGSFNLNLEGQTAGAVTVTATWGGTKTAYCTVTVANPTYSIAFDSSTPTFNFSGSGANNKASGSVTVTVRNTSAGNTPVSGAPVSLSATMATSNQAVVAARKTQFYGLKVDVNSGGLQDGGASFPVASGTTDSNGKVTLNLEDVVGERTLTLTASVTPPGGSAVTDTATVVFGNGPLAKFKAPLSTLYKWSTDYPVSGSTDPNTGFPAANICNGTVSYTIDTYYASSNLPSQADLKAVAANTGNGAWQAAGWTDYDYWTGEVGGGGDGAFIVYVNGNDSPYGVTFDAPVVCLRP